MKKSRDQMKEELLSLIRFNRERIPQDVLAKAEALAKEQLTQQTKKPESQSQITDETLIPYDRKAAQKVIEQFLSTFDKDGSFTKKLKEKMLSKSH